MPSFTLYVLYISSTAIFYYLIKTAKKMYRTVQFSELRISKQGTVLHVDGDLNIQT